MKEIKQSSETWTLDRRAIAFEVNKSSLLCAITRKEGSAMKYNLSEIMTRAWKLFRKMGLCFSECLHRAWITAKAAGVNAEKIAAAKAAAGITEEVKTWTAWKEAGYEVIHGSKALFGVDLIWGSKGDGALYKARFFGASQVQVM